MKSLSSLYLFIFISSLFIFSSCEKDDPVIPDEEELITSMIYRLVPGLSGQPLELSFRDSDGDGGNAPVVIEVPLKANTTYEGALQLWNESIDPAEELTGEIEEEASSHQFFFQKSNGLNLDIQYNDQDSDGNPLGLKTLLSTGEPSTGTLTITLRHEPDKSAAGVAGGDITNAGGETDIQVTFNLVIE